MISNDALTKSLSGFAEYARLNGLRISTSEVIDGVSACTVLTPLSLQELKDVLRPCLIKNPASLEKYEKIYWEYFRSDTKITPSLVASLAVLKNQQKHGKNNYENKPHGKENSLENSLENSSENSLKRPAWQDGLSQYGAIPASLKEFLSGEKYLAAVSLTKQPLTDSDKKAITIAVSKLAESGKLKHQDLSDVLSALKEYAKLADTVEKMRSVSMHSTKQVHRSHSQVHSWSKPAFWSADISPDLLNTNLEHINQNQLARLIAEIERAAAALKPHLTRSPGMLRKKLALDYRKTICESLATFGEPFRLVSSAKRRRLRRLVTICDVSGSVKKVTGLLMAFLYGLHQSFDGRVKHFIFVSEIDEVTPYFSMGSYGECFDRIMQSAAVDYRGYSNYGNMLERLWTKNRNIFDHETIVMFLGDARTNKYNPREDIINKLNRITKKVFFLNPEPRAKWYSGDSAVRYYEKTAEMVEISSFAELLKFLNKLPEMVLIN